MDPPAGQDAKAGIRDVRIRGPRLLLRALRPGEIEEEWQVMAFRACRGKGGRGVDRSRQRGDADGLP